MKTKILCKASTKIYYSIQRRELALSNFPERSTKRSSALVTYLELRMIVFAWSSILSVCTRRQHINFSRYSSEKEGGRKEESKGVYTSVPLVVGIVAHHLCLSKEHRCVGPKTRIELLTANVKNMLQFWQLT